MDNSANTSHFWTTCETIIPADFVHIISFNAELAIFSILSLFRHREDPTCCRDLSILLNISDRDIEQMIETYIASEPLNEAVYYLENFLRKPIQTSKVLD